MKTPLSNAANYIKYIFRYVLRPRALLSRRNLDGMITYSQAGQDLMVLMIQNFKTEGLYVEIGSQDPIKNSNTFLLETKYKWKGISVEIRDDFSFFFKLRRNNPCLKIDAIHANYERVFQDHGIPKQIDYLQVDIDPADASLTVLRQLPLGTYRFGVITFEHDEYQSGSSVKNESRKLLHDHGYHLIAGGVTLGGASFEDWWVDPSLLGKSLTSSWPGLHNQEYREILRRIKQFLSDKF